MKNMEKGKKYDSPEILLIEFQLEHAIASSGVALNEELWNGVWS